MLGISFMRLRYPSHSRNWTLQSFKGQVLEKRRRTTCDLSSLVILTLRKCADLVTSSYPMVTCFSTAAILLKLDSPKRLQPSVNGLVHRSTHVKYWLQATMISLWIVTLMSRLRSVLPGIVGISIRLLLANSASNWSRISQIASICSIRAPVCEELKFGEVHGNLSSMIGDLIFSEDRRAKRSGSWSLKA